MRTKVYIDKRERRRMSHKQIGCALRAMGLDTSKDWVAWDDPAVFYSKAYSGEALEQIGAASG